LVALRAVGGNVEKVAPLAPDDVLLKAIEQRVRCFEHAGRLQVRRYDDASDGATVRCGRQSRDADVAKAEKCEVRLVDFLFTTLQRVPICLTCEPQISRVEVAGAIQHFRKPQRDGGTSWATDFESRPPCEILAQIE